jgi:histone acetyltransferase 1
MAPSKSGLLSLATFHPNFTYPIFGEEERIFGYKGLRVSLRYRANDMRPHLKISYDKKMKPVGDSEPQDVAAILQEGNHLPKSTLCYPADYMHPSHR